MSSTPSPPEERQLLEQKLMVQVRAAQEAWHAASEHYRTALNTYGGLLDQPDGGYALRQAAAAERCALEKYGRTLRSFMDLVLHGRRPQPDSNE